MDGRVDGPVGGQPRSSLRACLWVVAGTVAVLAVLWMAPAYACTPQARMAAAPPEADAGSTVQAGGTRFFPDAPVTIRWNSAEGPVLAEGSTTGAGEFDLTVTIPEVEPGIYAITAVQEVAGRSWPVHAAFEVLVPETPPAACPPESTATSAFTDIAGNLHRDAITCTAWYGIAQGTTATTYAPAQGVRRDQMATFLARMLTQAGVELPEVGDAPFTDTAGNPHAEAIAQLAELGIVRGTSATTYAPGQGVRRDQMAALLARTLEHLDGPLPAAEAPFTDLDGNPHAQAIGALHAAGIAQGSTATTYAPTPVVRRDQMAAFLTRALQHLVAGGHPLDAVAAGASTTAAGTP